MTNADVLKMQAAVDAAMLAAPGQPFFLGSVAFFEFESRGWLTKETIYAYGTEAQYVVSKYSGVIAQELPSIPDDDVILPRK